MHVTLYEYMRCESLIKGLDLTQPVLPVILYLHSTRIAKPSYIVHIGRGKRETCSESLNENVSISSVFKYYVSDRTVLTGVEPLFPDSDDIASLYFAAPS